MAGDDPAADSAPDRDTDGASDHDTDGTTDHDTDGAADHDTSRSSPDGSAASGSSDREGDTFGVAIRVTDREFRFLVRVPSEIDSGWTDPDAFQSRIERVTWDRLDKRTTLRAVDRVADPGETVSLGTVRMRPDGTVLDHSLAPPEAE